jgi:uncharacterized Zn-finger protein
VSLPALHDIGRVPPERGAGYGGAVGDTFQVIADVEASEATAPVLAASVVGLLRDSGVIAAARADCVLGAASGYPPGPGYAAAVTDPDELLPGLKVNGVEVTAARSVFFPGQGEVGPVTCPRCGHEVELRDPAHWALFGDAIGNWMAAEPSEVTCPYCQLHAGLNDWIWGADWPVAVGFLGFTFWNWPPLSSSFIAQVQAHLGHRVVVIRGKL